MNGQSIFELVHCAGLVRTIFVNFQYLGISIVINNSISEEQAVGIRQISEPELISECLQIISVSRLRRVSVVQPASPRSGNELENNSSREFFLFLLSPQCLAGHDNSLRIKEGQTDISPAMD